VRVQAWTFKQDMRGMPYSFGPVDKAVCIQSQPRDANIVTARLHMQPLKLHIVNMGEVNALWHITSARYPMPPSATHIPSILPLGDDDDLILPLLTCE
jgi:hypothetical protein